MSNERLRKYRDHARAALRKVPHNRCYALDDSATDALGALLATWQEERAQRGLNYDADEAVKFLAELAKHIPQLVQAKPSDVAQSPPQAWVDEITNRPAKNPFTEPQDVTSQVLLQKHEPALAEHLKRIARDGGVRYSYLIELREAEAARQRRAAIAYTAADHTPQRNPFLSDNVTAQNKLMHEDPERAAFYRTEAEPVRLPWQPGCQNMSVMSRISAADPQLGELVRKAEALIEQWTRDELHAARAAEEHARAARIAAEQRLALPTTTK